MIGSTGRAFLAAVVLGLTANAPSSAAAEDNSCAELLANARFALRSDPAKAYVSVFWTTNYRTGNLRFVGWGEVNFKLRAGDMVGDGKRTRLVMPGSGQRAQTASESVTLRIKADDTIVFHDMYGPYQMTCPRHENPALAWPAHGYAMVNSGDSVEILNLSIQYAASPGLTLY